jgi:hypothetical protein
VLIWAGRQLGHGRLDGARIGACGTVLGPEVIKSWIGGLALASAAPSQLGCQPSRPRRWRVSSTSSGGRSRRPG